MSLFLSKLRKKSISFYKNLGFNYEESAPLLHEYFPNSFNMSAGFVQLEPYIHNKKEANNQKITTIQKCIRHFDRKKAGMDQTHMTFFEMFGSLTIGKLDRFNYLSSIWEFFTKELSINPDKLCVTVFKGDTIFGKKLDTDTEALEIWKKIGLKDEQIIFGGKDDVFWFQGGNNINDNFKISPFDTLLSGYQSEVFYDWESDKKDRGDFFTNQDRYLEIGNNLSIVFEFNPKTETFSDLKNPASETVFGIERVQAVLENKKNVWEIEIFRKFFEYTDKIRLSKKKSQVILDRLRSLLMYTIEESVVVGRNGRGRILKGFKQDIFSVLYEFIENEAEIEVICNNLVDIVCSIMEEFYPETKNRKICLEKFILEQNVQYLEMLNKAKRSIDNYIKRNNLEKFKDKEKTMFYQRFGIREPLLKKYYPNQI